MAVEIRQQGKRKALEILKKVESNYVCLICGSTKQPNTKECSFCGKITVTVIVPKQF